ncbi:MAG: matrixin family metalloprotease [Bdellovibrionales bacterium]|nr:matrixin family metalloprotease [Bdellovibrionales bacterium]
MTSSLISGGLPHVRMAMGFILLTQTLMEPKSQSNRLSLRNFNKELNLELKNSINWHLKDMNISKAIRFGGEVIFASILLFSGCASKNDQNSTPPTNADETSGEISEDGDPQPEMKVISLPLEVYLYDFAGEPDYSSTLNEDEVAELVSKANEIFAQAKIEFNVISTVKRSVSAAMFDIVDPEDNTTTKQKFAKIVPPYPTDRIVWRTGIVRKMPIPAGGLYIAKLSFFAEQNKDGEFHYTIFAHEIAHALGLNHTQIPGNLMTPGNAAVALQLNAEQIEKVRAQALIGPKGQ